VSEEIIACGFLILKILFNTVYKFVRYDRTLLSFLLFNLSRNCPIDLKEAVSSVIFASPRCADIPELVDVKKQLTSKYGKEFVSAAIELRPDCGVSRMVSLSTCLKLGKDKIILKLISNLILSFQLIEKLSAKAPDGPTKIKILAAIAEEHNIKWEPKSFEENDVKSSQDLLVGTTNCSFCLAYFDIKRLLDYLV